MRLSRSWVGDADIHDAIRRKEGGEIFRDVAFVGIEDGLEILFDLREGNQIGSGKALAFMCGHYRRERGVGISQRDQPHGVAEFDARRQRFGADDRRHGLAQGRCQGCFVGGVGVAAGPQGGAIGAQGNRSFCF